MSESAEYFTYQGSKEGSICNGLHDEDSNTIYVAGKSQELSTYQTLLHELTHCITNIVFSNSMPFFAEDIKSKKKFARICETLHLAYINKATVPSQLTEAFRLYKEDKSDLYSEFIPRLVELIVEDNIEAEGDIGDNYPEEVKAELKELLSYYQNNFLKECEKYLFHMRCKNKVFNIERVPAFSLALSDESSEPSQEEFEIIEVEEGSSSTSEVSSSSSSHDFSI